ncbi:MBL fold metallo-hydrolase [Clostridium tyrobutyricum]|jgi:glyoxylase-like metal-dependent hydrolase (beta-lactamase superfamily II)|uniref:Zinc metallohydrolase, glyoxalase II family n=1 Tax=Clostridium tyrobutyricum DIVETGP TaxID=1408889 RepID=W6NLW0_CLOTY|nr:MBL fold metallo-hydrolase [Clostridium tyrobutyricum]AND84698.1 zinc-dependent hydrolase [Clostridium tyrobutyricum]ANP69295.1 hydrolase [Clostridium tyrobutyricum]MBV4435308.1 MBL fold metallo-hydrolase [Clostridium tyrobutyricum]MCH4199564.1 MBL fold metallo-hydrolase [Clostridium tyrobutyricum]MCH4259942.1 MBL fold metallo-hydrolase [Clostridium tyrobutyricum]
MIVKNIKGNTFCIDTGMTYIPFYKINDDEIIMLDSGLKKGERRRINDFLEQNNLKIAAIICSHAHIDHIGNNAYFKEKYNCIIAMSECEAFFCSSILNLKIYYSSQSMSEVEKHLGHMICGTDIVISNNQDKVNVCGIEFKIMHTPGHSPGHICIITPDDVAYLADSLISYEVMKGAKMPYAYILKQDLESKSKLYDLKYSKYIVAHKGIYDDITQLIVDNIEFYKSRAYRIYDIVEGSMTMQEIFSAVITDFKIPIGSIYKYDVIERMLHSYLEYLYEVEMLKLNIENGFLKYSK